MVCLCSFSVDHFFCCCSIVPFPFGLCSAVYPPLRHSPSSLIPYIRTPAHATPFGRSASGTRSHAHTHTSTKKVSPRGTLFFLFPPFLLICLLRYIRSRVRAVCTEKLPQPATTAFSLNSPDTLRTPLPTSQNRFTQAHSSAGAWRPQHIHTHLFPTR